MKRNSVVSIVLLVVALVVSTFGTTSALAVNLGNGIDLPGLKFGINSYEQWDGRTTFSSNLSTLDQITRANVSVSKDTVDPLQGWISINFGGAVNVPAVQSQQYQSSSISLNYRGLSADTNVGIGAYQDVTWVYPPGGGEGQPVYGDWMSTADASVTLSGVTLLHSNGGYNEYDYMIDGDKGLNSVDFATEFSAYAQFRVQFDSLAIANMYSSMAPVQMTSVPEPTTIGILALGAIGLIRRRRRQ